MSDSPEIAIPRRCRRILLSGVLLVAVGFGVWWGLQQTQATPANPLSTHSPQQQEFSATKKAQATAEEIDRVAYDHNADPEQRRIAFESIGDAAAARGDFDAAFEAYISAEIFVHAAREQITWVELRAKAFRMLRKAGHLRAASELFSSVVLTGWIYMLPNGEALQQEGEELYAELNPSDSKEDKLAIYRHVFRIRESVLGPKHPTLAWDLDELARTLTEFGESWKFCFDTRLTRTTTIHIPCMTWQKFTMMQTISRKRRLFTGKRPNYPTPLHLVFL